MNPAEGTCEEFVRTWAEEVRRQVARVRELRETFATQMGQAEHGASLGQRELTGYGDPSPGQLDATSRRLWVAQHQVVWSAHQLERWSQRLAKERGDTPSSPDPVLVNLRNALEHLDDAEFEDEGHAAADSDRRNRSLHALPRAELFLGPDEYGGSKLFGLIDPADLEQRALAVIEAAEREVWSD
ncbi:MAG: hypothetical protein ACREX8_05955 [Gammaproteobacteria bacterium]